MSARPFRYYYNPDNSMCYHRDSYDRMSFYTGRKFGWQISAHYRCYASLKPCSLLYIRLKGHTFLA